MIALVDCNNFYASCERVFRPALLGKPIAVLSNNDGCVIARSQEAKDLGVAMGEPYFKRKAWFAENNIFVFSSNYPLYGDLSRRVMDTLSQIAPNVEVYSIDEAFLDFTNCPYFNIETICLKAKHTVERYTGIPVSIGIAPTKALAKLANKRCKKLKLAAGVLQIKTQSEIDELLQATDIHDVWGIGGKYAHTLCTHGITTAYRLAHANDAFLRKHLTVGGLKLAHELRGIPCFAIDTAPAPKKNICTSRSFGSPVTALSELHEAVANYAARCAYKLREQQSACRLMNIFLQTNPFDTRETFRSFNRTITLPIATNDTGILIRLANQTLQELYVPGLRYKKAGVLVLDLVPEATTQASLFDPPANPLRKKLMQVMDTVNRNLGSEKVKLAVQGMENMNPHTIAEHYKDSTRPNWKLRRAHLSPCYTTRWEHVLEIGG